MVSSFSRYVLKLVRSLEPTLANMFDITFSSLISALLSSESSSSELVDAKAVSIEDMSAVSDSIVSG